MGTVLGRILEVWGGLGEVKGRPRGEKKASEKGSKKKKP